MATAALITEAQYLHTSYPKPIPEFRDGQLVERTYADWSHSESLVQLILFFGHREESLALQFFPNLTVRLRPGRHVIPDITVYWPEGPNETIHERCPQIIIEILSPDDSMSDVRGKLDEYAEWGVPHIWLIDPRRRIFYMIKDGLHEVKSLEVPELALQVTPADAFPG